MTAHRHRIGTAPLRLEPVITRLVTALLAAILIALTAMTVGCSSSLPAAPVASAPRAGSAAADAQAGTRIVLRFQDTALTATLLDTPATRQLVTMLPLVLELRDPMGQAKSGHLRAPLDVAGAATVTDPDLGGVYYVPDAQLIAMFYDDLGQRVPPPGLVRLGTLDDPDALGAVAHSARVRMDLADRASA